MCALPVRVLIFLCLGFSVAQAKGLHTQDDCEFIRERLRDPHLNHYQIPAGTYTCAEPLVLDRNHFSLSGEIIQGGIATTLKLADAANAPVIVMGDAKTPPAPLEDIEVANLHIDGNRKGQSMECWGGPCDSGGTSYVRNNGISVRGLTRGRIQNVAIQSARSGGVVTERGCYDLRIDRLTSVDNFFDGFAGYQTEGAVISNTLLARNQAAGISIDIDFHKNTFENVRIEDNGDVGIFMRDSNQNLFNNLQIHRSGNHGIFIALVEAPETCPIENQFHNLVVTESRGWGFLLNNACAGNRLTGTTRLLRNQAGCLREPSEGMLNIGGPLQCEN